MALAAGGCVPDGREGFPRADGGIVRVRVRELLTARARAAEAVELACAPVRQAVTLARGGRVARLERDGPGRRERVQVAQRVQLALHRAVRVLTAVHIDAPTSAAHRVVGARRRQEAAEEDQRPGAARGVEGVKMIERIRVKVRPAVQVEEVPDRAHCAADERWRTIICGCIQ